MGLNNHRPSNKATNWDLSKILSRLTTVNGCQAIWEKCQIDLNFLMGIRSILSKIYLNSYKS